MVTLEVMDMLDNGALRLAGRDEVEDGGGPEYVRTSTGCEYVPVVVLLTLGGAPVLLVY